MDMNIMVIDGKKSSQIARENKLTHGTVNKWAKANDILGISFDGGKTVEFYVFDEKAEKAFLNRKTKPGRWPEEKPPEEPKKMGRPRIERPVYTGPKNPVGRPRKPLLNYNMMDDIVTRPRGRPRKGE